MTDPVLRAQAEYYRRRAEEYDATAYGDLSAARERIARVLRRMQPTGSVLEIACGTGLWTEALAGVADSVLAIDVAPEALSIARGRARSANVMFESADIFSWTNDRRFDVIFFSAWLSHVPRSHFERFWGSLGRLLADEGRVLFVDEHVPSPGQGRDKETYLSPAGEIVERRLADGSSHRIVKNFVDPEVLPGRLRELGWDCEIRLDGDDWVWVCGEARPAMR